MISVIKMKVILLDGVRTDSIGYTQALQDLQNLSAEKGIEVCHIRLKDELIQGCTGCGKCIKAGKCLYNEQANTVSEAMKTADALIIAASVYYGGLDSRMKCLLDCLFHSAPLVMANKPAGSLLICRSKVQNGWMDLLPYYAEADMIYITDQFHGEISESSYTEENRMTVAHLVQMTASLHGAAEADLPERRMHFVR